MVLTVNISNQAMTAGFYDGSDSRRISRVSIHRGMTPDDFFIKLSSIADMCGADCAGSFRAIVGSVAPRHTMAAIEAVTRLCGEKPYIIGPGIKTGINIKINDPSQLGADLVAMAAGVSAKYPLPALLVSISEATTISYIDAQSRYLGTVIYAGMEPMLRSMVENAELLTSVTLTTPERLLGASTEESIRSGIMHGTASFLDGMTAKLAKKHEVVSVIATGSDMAQAVLCLCERRMIWDESLLTDGMYHIFMRQNKQ